MKIVISLYINLLRKLRLVLRSVKQFYFPNYFSALFQKQSLKIDYI